MKRVAILSDIHANHIALDAVLADLGRIAPDRVVCLGDVAATGPGPVEVMARVRSMGWDIIRGNCDDAVLRYAAGEVGTTGDEHDGIDEWCASQLSAQDLLLITSFSPVVTISVEDVSFCCYHGSPRSNLDEIHADTPVDQIERWFRGQSAVVYAGGHTHVQMIRRYRDGYVINPGSVGLPFTVTADGDEINPLWAEYALVTVNGKELAIELRRIPVSADAIRAAAAASAMPHKSWWSSDWR